MTSGGLRWANLPIWQICCLWQVAGGKHSWRESWQMVDWQVLKTRVVISSCNSKISIRNIGRVLALS